jgi:leucyl-tRNA synthetase
MSTDADADADAADDGGGDAAYDHETVEREWRRRFADSGRYEPDPEGGEAPIFITVPYPYPSGGMHVGHARTYLVPDVYARFERLRGEQVLFPMAWHFTGTPIVGAVERVKQRDPDQIETLTGAFDVPESDLEKLETPEGYARYFAEEADASYKRGMQQLGLSVDWRREFTTGDERYSKFVAWQYRTLKERGLLEEGLHPVNFCTNERQPVTTHDLLEGEEAEFQEFTLVRFGYAGDDAALEAAVLPMATLRPETVRGVTNAYVDPEATYARATVDEETWVVSAAATEKFELQGRDVTVHERFPGERLVGADVANPVTDERVVVLPAAFVDAAAATGVVMSVPAHSPDDYLALREVQARADELPAYGIDPDRVRDIDPVPILEIDDYGEVPARDAVEAAGIDSSTDPALVGVTQDLYQSEFHRGRLLEPYGEFAGETVADVRETFRDHHGERGNFDRMYEFTEPVVCRCGGDVEVAQQDTWFLRYNDDEWRELAHEVADSIDAVPENTREQYHHTVDWLEEWPCIRDYGLGTRLPWDEEFVIEPLSDSTIYMSYYTIAHRIRDVPVEELDQEFFDTLLLGEGSDERAETLREEFEHWYPVDVRFSANDLVNNHLTFFQYHHAELFDRDEWPQGITIMGMGLKNGEKMSSSKGNVELPGEVVDEYGADTVRFFQLNAGEPWQDFDWRPQAVASTRAAVDDFWSRAVVLIETEAPDDPDLRPIDRWLLSKLQSTVRTVTESLTNYETREASQAVFYDFEEHLRWYRRRVDTDDPAARHTLRRVLRTRLRLLAPFMPFLTNELHERLTGEPAEDADWPEPTAALDEPAVETAESLVRALTEDVHEVRDVTGTDPEVLRVYVAADWKRDVLATVEDHAPAPDRGTVMGEVMADPDLREWGDAVNELVGDLVEFVRERPAAERERLADVNETTVYETAADFLAREFDADVAVYREDGDPHDPADRADSARPFRPAIHIE